MIADINDWREPPKLELVAGNAMLMDCDPEPPEAQALWRAAKRAGIAERLYEADRRLEGYAWYGALERIAGGQTEITVDGRTVPLDKYPEPDRAGGAETPRPEAVRMNLAVKSGEGPVRALALGADLAFAGEAWTWVGDVLPLVTVDNDIDPCELARLLYAAYFSTSDDADADSWERQRTDFDREAHHAATALLVSDSAARCASIADVVERELLWLIPHDADISVRNHRPAPDFL